MALNDKLNKLDKTLKKYGKITVALSGGVDSAFLLAFSYKSLGAENVSAVTASGPHLSMDEIEYAKHLCEKLGIKHEIADMNHILELISHNPVDRCYLCKKEMFSVFKQRASSSGAVLADGTNSDDMNDFRPGLKALRELNTASPLKDAGLTKCEIRAALHELSKDPETADALSPENGFPIWEKPAMACLASRIPYGDIVTEEKLRAVYESENFLRSLGFRQVRVRHHEKTARIEVPAEERNKFFDEALMDKVDAEIRKHGFSYVVLDLKGYSMGGGYNAGKNSYIP